MAAWLIPATGHAQGAVMLQSPDHRNEIRIDPAEGLRYRVVRDGQTALADSPVGLLTDRGSLGEDPVSVLAVERSSADQRYVPVAGKASSVPDRYAQVILHLARISDGLRFDLIARAYDDGVAFRFEVPQQKGLAAIDLYGESTGFFFPADYDCWGYNPGSEDGPHEGEFDPVKASAIRPFHLFDAPLVCRIDPRGTTFAIAEADKRDYAGAYYRGRGDGGLGVTVSLTPRADHASEGTARKVAVHVSLASGPLVTPWRVVMLGDRPGSLVQSNLIALLAEPSRIKDTSWIKPGKAAWDWWNGWAVDVPDAGVNTATYRAYVDFAQKMNLEYILIDEGWYRGSSEQPIPADVTKPVPAMNIPEIVRYAGERKVGVWVWVHWKQLERQLDDALALYERWGIKGIKVDFMDRTDQDMVTFYHRLLAEAARHKLMVDLHGAYPPDGLTRTYPNFLTQEGVLGAEYNKWSTRITATHNVTLPFTRMLLGPMDYTPGGFRSLAPDAFAGQVRFKRPFVQTTRGQALAMYVVYDSPFAMLADSPDAYVGSDGALSSGAELLRDIPTSWDETRVPAGEIGRYIVTVRRKGDRWYVGAMTNEHARKLDVPLDFLPAGTAFAATLYEDGADRNSVRKKTMAVRSDATLSLDLAASGGGVVVLDPVTRSGRGKGGRW